jgi:protein TonB
VHYDVFSELQRKMFWRAIGLAVALHATVILGLILLMGGSAEGKFKTLAVMDFAYYDPDGGEPGGGEIDDAPPETAAEPEPEPEPEPDEIDLVTSTSEEAAPPPPPPPVVKKDKPKPKPAPQKSAEDGEVKPGGGPGDGQGGVGGGTGRGNPNAFNAYVSRIRAKLNRLKKYPPAAASQRLGGIVTVNFTIDRGGNVITSRMVNGSGHPVLDQEAMALLKRCSPFPAMPKELTETTLNLTVPIQFKPQR